LHFWNAVGDFTGALDEFFTGQDIQHASDFITNALDTGNFVKAFQDVVESGEILSAVLIDGMIKLADHVAKSAADQAGQQAAKDLQLALKHHQMFVNALGINYTNPGKGTFNYDIEPYSVTISEIKIYLKLTSPKGYK
jgi:hypothetical protein